MATRKKRKQKPADPAAPKNKGGRPKVIIDLKQVETMASLHFTKEEAAAVLGCGKRTFEIRLREPAYREAWSNGRLKGKASLRRLQWRHANAVGSSAVNMTKHLSAHWLGETDQAAIQLTGKDGGPIVVTFAKSDAGLL